MNFPALLLKTLRHLGGRVDIEPDGTLRVAPSHVQALPDGRAIEIELNAHRIAVMQLLTAAHRPKTAGILTWHPPGVWQCSAVPGMVLVTRVTLPAVVDHCRQKTQSLKRAA